MRSQMAIKALLVQRLGVAFVQIRNQLPVGFRTEIDRTPRWLWQLVSKA
jgi:hypothetical protein